VSWRRWLRAIFRRIRRFCARLPSTTMFTWVSMQPSCGAARFAGVMRWGLPP